MNSRRPPERRDQAPSSFAPTLGRLCDSSGVLAAVLVDQDGEAVDYAGRAAPFDIRIAAAEWRIILSRLHRSQCELQATSQFVVRGGKKSFAVVQLPEGYALVVELLPHCFRISPRALAEAVRELCEEACLAPKDPPPDWTRVQVLEQATSERLPEFLWLAKKWAPVQVLSRCAASEHDMRSNEVGYCVRFPNGVEATLVREPLAQWFASPAAAFT